MKNKRKSKTKSKQVDFWGWYRELQRESEERYGLGWEMYLPKPESYLIQLVERGDFPNAYK